MFTCSPAKTIWPSSIGWMPAMHLISVDLPAPLSPTSAMTSPGATWKSTWYRACTAPKLFDTPRNSRIGLSLTSTPPKERGGDPSRGMGPHSPLEPDCLALGLELH